MSPDYLQNPPNANNKNTETSPTEASAPEKETDAPGFSSLALSDDDVRHVVDLHQLQILLVTKFIQTHASSHVCTKNPRGRGSFTHFFICQME